MHIEVKSENVDRTAAVFSWKAHVWKRWLSDESVKTVQELRSSNTSHPSTLAFQNHSYTLFPRNE